MPAPATIDSRALSDRLSSAAPPRILDVRTAGEFGTAHIAVAQRPNAVIIPAAAILRDDVNGTTRVAVVDAGGRAHWTMVSAGVQQGNEVEILSPPLVPGTRVIVSGQVGLPDSSHVVEAPAASTSISGERAPTAHP